MVMRSGTAEEREVEDEKKKWAGRLTVRGTREEGSIGGLENEKPRGKDEIEVLVLRRVGMGKGC